MAFLYRGICKFEEKVILAAEAGAAVVVIVNNNPEGVITMSIGSKLASLFNMLPIKASVFFYMIFMPF